MVFDLKSDHTWDYYHSPNENSKLEVIAFSHSNFTSKLLLINLYLISLIQNNILIKSVKT